ncbi:MAG: DUF4160 domain-containing protein [Planctomycetes bacterium]|nr:DUF4160 domain-containing protein [Planctomycetota bacterium]MBU4398268.1 DUF4160 domain-containing protein [Planctomycetota bacterium]MCG2684928.1 DUF4160 domain-containing protein [Planctomycetales bacterium]
MPTILRVHGYRFFFFTREGSEPPHIHIENAGNYAKYWIRPVRLARNRGFLSRHLRMIRSLVEEYETLFEEKWNERFGY